MNCRVNVIDLGAAGDGKAVDTHAVQSAVDACAKAGGGTVYFPPGCYRIGCVYLRSHVALHIDPGATIVLSRAMADYTELGTDSYVRHMDSRFAAFHAVGLENVSVVGGGVIDGDLAYDEENSSRRGPICLNFEHCRNISVRDITLVNNPGGASLNCFACTDITIEQFKDYWSFAGGPNLSCCRNVLLDHVLVVAAQDDPICLKNDSFEYCWASRPPVGFLSEHITIRNTTVRDTDHGAIKIGTGSFGVFRDIHVTNCLFENVTDMFRIQLYRPKLAETPRRAIEDVTFTHITMHHVDRLLNWGGANADTPVINGVTVQDVVADGASKPSIMMGLPKAPIRNVDLKRIKLSYVDKEQPDPCWLDARFVEGLTLQDVHLDLGHSVESALFARDCKNIELDGFRCERAREDSPTLRVEQVRGLTVRNSKLPEVQTFLRALGKRTRNIVLADNDTSGPATLFEADDSVSAAAIKPIAGDVVYSELRPVKTRVQPNEPLQISITATNPGAPGAVRIQAVVDGEGDETIWLWLENGESRRVTLSTSRYYPPGAHQIRVGPLTCDVEVGSGPAELRLMSPVRFTTPATPGMPTQVRAHVRNVGGASGSRRIDLSLGDTVIASRRVTLDPGKKRQIAFKHVFDDAAPCELRLGDLPSWHYATFPDDFDGVTRDGTDISVEASCADLDNAPYAGVYHAAVTGDFVATVRIPPCDTDLPYGQHWAGLVAAKRFAEPDSAAANLVLVHVPPLAGARLLSAHEFFSASKFFAVPLWLKLERTGTTITGYLSDDGRLWQRPCTSNSPAGRKLEGLLPIDADAASLQVGFYLFSPDRQMPRIRQVFQDFCLQRPAPQSEIEFTELRLSATRAALYEPVTATAVITNRSGMDGPVRAGLYVDDHEHFTRWLCLRRNESRSVSFTFTPLLINSKASLPHHCAHPHYWRSEHLISIGNSAGRHEGCLLGLVDPRAYRGMPR